VAHGQCQQSGPVHAYNTTHASNNLDQTPHHLWETNSICIVTGPLTAHTDLAQLTLH